MCSLLFVVEYSLYLCKVIISPTQHDKAVIYEKRFKKSPRPSFG